MNAAESVSKAQEFHRIAREVFAPIYPVLASQILAAYEELRGEPLMRGRCLDVGSAAGHLGVALARLSDLDVTLCDISSEALGLSSELTAGTDLAGRIAAVVADAQDLPWLNEEFDLVVSRGSLWFWTDKARAFSELWRVLKPGGLIYAGGGFGSAELRDSIHRIMTLREGERWAEGQRRRREGNSAEDLASVLKSLGLPFRVIDDDSGLWAIVAKHKDGDRRGQA
jgi:SAM-dependent methyltransferase